MIVKGLLEIIYALFWALTIPINIPTLPEGVNNAISSLASYVSTGACIVSSYTHYDYLITLLIIVVGVDVGVGVYHMVMFFIKKIPFLGIK